MAILNVRNLAHPNPPKHWHRQFAPYDCEFCRHYHIGHKGLEERAQAFTVKGGQIVFSWELRCVNNARKNIQGQSFGKTRSVAMSL